MVARNGKCGGNIPLPQRFLRPGSGVVYRRTAMQPALKIGRVFSDIMRSCGVFCFVLCPEDSGKRAGQLCRAGKMLLNGLCAGAVLADVCKRFHKTFLPAVDLTLS